MIKIEELDGQLMITIPLHRESNRCKECGTIIESRQWLTRPEDDIRLLGLHLAYWVPTLGYSMIRHFADGVRQSPKGDQ